MNLPAIIFGDQAPRYISLIEGQRGEISVARHAHDFGELLGLAQSGIARIVILTGPVPELSMSFVDQLTDCDLAVIQVCDEVDFRDIPGLHHISNQLRDEDFLTKVAETLEASSSGYAQETFSGLDAEEVEVRGQDGQAAPTSLGRILTVWGPNGAPGRSTLAINLAALASQEKRVCLIDADTYAPSVSALLGMLEDYSGLAQLCHLADRGQLSGDKLREATSYIQINSHDLHVLTGITRTNRWPEIRPKPFEMVLTELRRHYDLIVVDVATPLEEDEELSFDGVAPRRNSATLTALSNSDEVLILGSADVIGLPRLIRACEDYTEFAETLLLAPKVSIWINKLRKNATGGNPETRVRQAWTRFGPKIPIAGFLPYNQEIIDKAWLNGRSLVEYAPKDPLTRAIKNLFEQMNKQEAQVAIQANTEEASGTYVRRNMAVSENETEPNKLHWFKKKIKQKAKHPAP